MRTAYEEQVALKRIARRVASHLMAALKAGTISKINIDTIRAALRSENDCPFDDVRFDAVEEMTTRQIVEMVG
jgi:hypothetical protein